MKTQEEIETKKEDKNICQIPKCKRVQHSIGWCKVHYKLLMPNCTQKLNKQD